MPEELLPVANDPLLAKEALDEHLALMFEIKGVANLEELGWTRPTPLTLRIPMRAVSGNQVDEFMLELGFSYYPDWPPSARFINPNTGAFDPATDYCWVPILDGSPAIYTHRVYNGPDGKVYLGFICCSFTLDYYLSRHGVSFPGTHWKAKDRKFLATISVLEHAMRTCYRGRMESNAA